MTKEDAGWPDSTGHQEPPAKAQPSVIPLPMGGNSIGGIIRKSRRVSLPDVLIRILILLWSSKEGTSRILRHFLLLVQFLLNSGITYYAAILRFPFIHIRFRANVVSLY